MNTCSFSQSATTSSGQCPEDVRFLATPGSVNPESMSGGLPRGTIRGNETVVLVLRPSRWFILIEPFYWIFGVVILAILASIVVAALQGLNMWPAWSLWLIWLVAGLISIMLVAWAMIERQFRVYVLTTERVLTCSGVIRRSIYETDLVNLRQTMLAVSVLERCTHTGSLLFATAGTAYYDTAWFMLSDPAAAQQQVQSMLRRASRSGAA